MRSKLKMFYDKKDKINLLEDKSYLIFSNPFYQVGKFLKEEKFYLDNYKNNLKDLKIETGNNSYYTCMYNEKNNTIYSDNYISDIFGLLHVASNNREKDGIGLVDKNGIGTGLNSGLTSLFASEIVKGNEVYSIEKIVAKTMMLVHKLVITDAYFNNEPSFLEVYKLNISELNCVLDEYHSNSLKLDELNRKISYLRFQIIRNDKLIKEIEEVIYELKNRNEILVYELFKLISDLIAYSCVDESKKNEITNIINNDLNMAYNMQGMDYLSHYEDDFKYMAYTKTAKVKRK